MAGRRNAVHRRRRHRKGGSDAVLHTSACARRGDDIRTWNDHLRRTGQPGDGRHEIRQEHDGSRNVAHARHDGTGVDAVKSWSHQNRCVCWLVTTKMDYQFDKKICQNIQVCKLN